MAFIDETRKIESISKEERIAFTKLEESAFQTEDDYKLLFHVLHDLALNKIADAILYSRLSQRLEFLSGETEDEEDYEDIVSISEILDEHSEEEFKFFQDVFSLAMEFGLACGMDFTSIPEASSRKFMHVNEMVDFVQNRELKSMSKFYTLLKVLKNSPILSELEEESQVHFLNLIRNIILQEVEHFEELKEFSEVGEDEETSNLILKIQEEAEKGI